VRGVFFADLGAGWFPDQGFTFATRATETVPVITGYNLDPVTGAATPVYGEPRTISGLRLQDARASYGFGLETFALGFPIHFDWAWRTLFNKDWEDVVFAQTGGHSAFRRARFAVWIGYDF